RRDAESGGRSEALYEITWPRVPLAVVEPSSSPDGGWSVLDDGAGSPGGGHEALLEVLSAAGIPARVLTSLSAPGQPVPEVVLARLPFAPAPADEGGPGSDVPGRARELAAEALALFQSWLRDPAYAT